MTNYYDHQCSKCGRLWYTRYAGYRVCPGCTRVPRLRRMWLRLRYRVTKKLWGKRKSDFIAQVWAPEVGEAIDASIELGNLVATEHEQDVRLAR